LVFVFKFLNTKSRISSDQHFLDERTIVEEMAEAFVLSVRFLGSGTGSDHGGVMADMTKHQQRTISDLAEGK
jgi:hypothetical protein